MQNTSNPASFGAGPVALLDTKAVAAFLGCSPITVRLWRYSGGGPKFVKVTSRQIRYRREDVEAWLQARTIGSTSEELTVPSASSVGRNTRAARAKARA